MDEVVEAEIRRQTDIVFNLESTFKATPSPQQTRILRAIKDKYICEGRVRANLRSCHSWGKTYTVALLCLDFLSTEPDPLLVTTAPTARQVTDLLWKEIKDKARPHRDRFHWDILPDAPKIKQEDKVIALGFSTDKPERFEGYHRGKVMVAVDEAKGVSSEIFEAIDGIGPEILILFSTPGAMSTEQEPNRFYETSRREEWLRFHINGEEHNQSTGEHGPSLAWIEQMQIDYGRDNPVYIRKVLGEFAALTENPYLDPASIDRAVKEVTKPVTTPHLLGVDWGKHRDYTALVELNGHHVGLVKTFKLGTDYTKIMGEINQMHNRQPFDKVIADLGAGEGQVDRLREMGLPVEGFRFTIKSKLDIMSNLKVLLEEGNLDLPPHTWLQEQLKAFEQSSRSDGSIKLDAPQGMHDDLVDALALGCWGLRSSSDGNRFLVMARGNMS